MEVMAVDKAIDRFFGAALKPDDWPSALDAVAQSLGADGATLIIGNSSRQSLIESSTIKSHVAEYFRRGAPLDPRETRVKPALAEGFANDFRHFTRAEINRDPFYQDFLFPIGLGWHAVACLAEGADPIVLSLKRGASRGPFERGEIETLDKVLPHLRGAAEAARQAWGMALGDQLATLSEVGHGALLLDRHGRVVKAGAGVVLGDGLDTGEGRLQAAFPADQPMLDLVVGVAIAPDLPSALPPPAAIALHRPSGKRPLVVRGMPLDGARRSLLAPAVAMLLVTDLDSRPLPATGSLRTVFGLTPKEADLARRLAGGETVEQAAEALAISTQHARQRLKVIFDKTDTRRQSELIAVLLKLGR